MNDEQVNRLIDKFDEARKSFDNAHKQIRWNKVNTVIQYCLIFVVVAMLVFGWFYYKADQKERCESGNDLRVTIGAGMEQNALNIGMALAVVFGGDQEDVDVYLDAYRQQPKPPELTLREC